jgi:hypothetical protein
MYHVDVGLQLRLVVSVGISLELRKFIVIPGFQLVRLALRDVQSVETLLIV